MKISLWLLTLILSLSFYSTESFAKKKRRKKSVSQKGVVAVEGAAIYKEPNFDSPILDYLDKGKNVKMSRKVYRGSGGFGAFYKIKLAKKKYGYIADTEVAPTVKRIGGRLVENPEAKMVNTTPIDLVRWLGAGIGMVNYTEEFEGRKLSEFLPTFGFKMSGPGTMGMGPPLDFEFMISPVAPTYYEKFADQDSPAEGFLVIGNAVLNMDLYVGINSHVYYGLGIMSSFTKFDVSYNNEILDSQELRMGGIFHLGYFQRFGGWGMRLEGKYYLEREQYIAAVFAVQTEY